MNNTKFLFLRIHWGRGFESEYFQVGLGSPAVWYWQVSIIFLVYNVSSTRPTLTSIDYRIILLQLKPCWTKMCIIFTPYFFQKIVNWTLNMVLFYALVLMLITNFFPNSTFRRCSSGQNLLNYNTKFAPQMNQNMGAVIDWFWIIAPLHYLIFSGLN